MFHCLCIRYCKISTGKYVQGEMTNKLMINTYRRNDITQCWSSAGFNIALKREGEKEKKRSYYNTGCSYMVTHPRTNPAEQGLTLLSGRDAVLSLWYSSTLNALF